METVDPKTTNTEATAFRSLDPGDEFDNAPVSKLAIFSLSAGILSLLAPLSAVLLPLSVLAIALGIVTVWKISRDPGVAGTWIAQAGLGLGVFSAVWAVTATTSRNSYLTSNAAEHAEFFLETLAAGKQFEALELMQPEFQRRMAGTDLEAYYQQKTGEEAEMTAEFLRSGAAEMVMQRGSDADWKFSEVVSIFSTPAKQYVTVSVVNRNATDEKLNVQLLRLVDPGPVDENSPRGLWSVEKLEFP